jgi:hypothetical protein
MDRPTAAPRSECDARSFHTASFFRPARGTISASCSVAAPGRVSAETCSDGRRGASSPLDQLNKDGAGVVSNEEPIEDTEPGNR